MRVSLPFVGVIGIVLASTPVVGQQHTNFTLRRGYVGDLRIGMTVDEVLAMFGPLRMKKIDLYTENPYPEPAFEIRLRGLNATQASLVVLVTSPLDANVPLAQKKVSGVVVHDSRFRTDEGFGIGSTLGEIRAKY